MSDMLRPGSRRPSEVVADNIRSHRAKKGLSEDQVAERMSALGHAWEAEAVSATEDGSRALNVDEFLGVALVLGVSFGDSPGP